MLRITLRRVLVLALFAVPAAFIFPLVVTDVFRPAHAAPASSLPTPAQRDCAEAGAAFSAGVTEASEGGSVLTEPEAAQVVDILRACWAALQPDMAAAERSCDRYKADPGIREEVRAWGHIVQITGLAEALAAESAAITPWQIRALVNCYNEAFDKCVDQPDVTQAAEMLKIERELALLSADSVVDRTKHEKCLRFELVIDSRLTASYPSGQVYRSQVRATIPVRQADNLKFTGEAPLEIVSYTLQTPIGGACRHWIESFRAAEPLRIFSFQIDLEALVGHRADMALGLPARSVEIGLELAVLGTMQSVERIGCGESNPPDVSALGGQWDRMLWHVHLQTGDQPRVGGVIVVRDWSYVGDRIVARKVNDRSVVLSGELPVTETTTYELHHKPVR